MIGMSKKSKSEFINREISWLSFNHRVLQEAADLSVPLIERIRFLGIFSNNLDEFFKVRVATLRRATGISKKPVDPMDFDPEQTLADINTVVIGQQEKFDAIFTSLISALKKENVEQLNETQLKGDHKVFIEEYFDKHVRPYLVPLMLNGKTPFPQLNENCLYMAVELGYHTRHSHNSFALIEISNRLPRFIELPSKGVKKYWMFIDDIIRYHLKKVFGIFDYDVANAYAIKMTRDAELDIDDDFSKGFVEKMSRSLHQRKKGQYLRVNYDYEMPQVLLDFILKKIKIKNRDNTVGGSRYHNKRDLMKFPDFGRKDLCFPALKPIEHPMLKGKASIMDEVRKRDVMLHFPYHSFSYIIDLLREAAIDPDVKTIRISLYRVAKDSQIVNALVNAAKNGKRVVAVVELQARFDEENNIAVTNALQEAGVRVIPGVQGLKVHSKIIQISRKEGIRTVRYVHIGTGNFHEHTAGVYSDISLLTARKEIGSEVRRIFEFFESNFQRNLHRYLVVSPFNTRRKFTDLIHNEIELAKKGKPAWITLKMNNLVDTGMIRKLYEASNAGVKINLIIRGICSLVPGIPGESSNIYAVSIVGRYLEHSRIFAFGNGGKPLYYVSSADWMMRNIDHRIEVSTPVADDQLKRELQDFLDLQLDPNMKARLVEKSLKNQYTRPGADASAIDAQIGWYDYLNKKQV